MSIEKCLTKGCERPSAVVVKTGLCMICHSRAKKMVEAGFTTWQKLTKLGLVRSPDDDMSDPFTRALKEARAKQ